MVMVWMIGIGFIANEGCKYCNTQIKISGFITKGWDQQVLVPPVGSGPPLTVWAPDWAQPTQIWSLCVQKIPISAGWAGNIRVCSPWPCRIPNPRSQNYCGVTLGFISVFEWFRCFPSPIQKGIFPILNIPDFQAGGVLERGNMGNQFIPVCPVSSRILTPIGCRCSPNWNLSAPHFWGVNATPKPLLHPHRVGLSWDTPSAREGKGRRVREAHGGG